MKDLRNLYLPIFGLTLILISCQSSNKIGDQWNARILENNSDTKSLKVSYVTSRRKKIPASSICNSESFGTLTDSAMHFGDCSVGVPARRSIGDITIDNTQDKQKFFQLENRGEEEESNFFKRIEAHPFPEVIVFVHGFNVNFDEAVVRSSQIKFDLKFPGEVILFFIFFWSSDAGMFVKLLMTSVYDSNLEEAKLNRKLFQDFLTKLSKTKKEIHLIVHSMGHQVVLPALTDLYKKNPDKILSEMILNAPDFDKNEFSQVSQSLIGLSKRVTLYCSPGDNALVASQKVNGAARAGMCFKFPGIDVINVNEVDSPVLGVGGLGHGYYSSRPILTDIFQVLLGVDVEKRLFIRRSGKGNGEDFVLRK